MNTTVMYFSQLKAHVLSRLEFLNQSQVVCAKVFIILIILNVCLKVMCNGFSQNWWKVVSSCLLQYKSVYVINFDKLRCKMLKSKRLVVFCIVILRLIVMHDVISGCACFCLRCYWDSIKSYFTRFHYWDFSSENVK